MKHVSLTKFVHGLRRAIFVGVICALALFSTSATSQNVSKVSGELWVSGQVTVNGRPAATGMTVFSGGKIKVGPSSAATVQLGKRAGSIKLMADSDMELNLLSSVIGGQLVNGRITVVTAKGVAISVPTAMGEVISREPLESIFTIEATAERTKICVERGKGALKVASPAPADKPGLKAGGTIENVDQGESLTATANGQLARHRCSPISLAKDGGNGSVRTIGLPTVPVIAGTVGATVAGTAAVARPPVVGLSGPPLTPVRPSQSAPFCDCRFNPVTGRVLNPRQQTVICRRQSGVAPVTQTVTCSTLQTYFNADGTPRPGHEDDMCGVCPPN